jgi:hypothetical protein
VPPGRPGRNNIPAARRTFGGAIIKNVFIRLRIAADNVGLAAGLFHFMERPQFCGVSFQPPLDFVPGKAFMAAHVVLETSFQCHEKVCSLFHRQRFFTVAHRSNSSPPLFVMLEAKPRG